MEFSEVLAAYRKKQNLVNVGERIYLVKSVGLSTRKFHLMDLMTGESSSVRASEIICVLGSVDKAKLPKVEGPQPL